MRLKTLARIIYKLRPKGKPSVIIGEPYTYMHRWYVIPRNKYFNIYLHQYWGDDADEATHDHPWKSWSLCLNGVIKEAVGKYPPFRNRLIVAGDFVYRSETFAHKLSIPPQNSAPWTLFITWRTVRQWGFYCPKGWKHWKEFTAYAKTGDSTRRGAGCGEH